LATLRSPSISTSPGPGVRDGHPYEPAVLCRWGLTAQQYNVIRILYFAEPEGVRLADIWERLPQRVPDVTRLVDRLEAAGLARRLPDRVTVGPSAFSSPNGDAGCSSRWTSRSWRRTGAGGLLSPGRSSDRWSRCCARRPPGSPHRATTRRPEPAASSLDRSSTRTEEATRHGPRRSGGPAGRRPGCAKQLHPRAE